MVVKRKPRKPVKKRISHEHNLQVSFFKWLAMQYPKVRKVTFAICNGARTTIREAIWLKEEGLTKSIPDVFVSVPRGTYAGFYIEFKHKPNVPTEEQLQKHIELREQGYRVDVIYDIEAAIKEVTNYLGV